MKKDRNIKNKVNNKNDIKKNKGAFVWVLSTAGFAVVIVFLCQFVFVGNFNNEEKFMQNTTINGIDVSGLTKKQAENIVSYNLLKTRDDVKLNLTYNDKNWQFTGSDFEVVNDVGVQINQVYKTQKPQKFFDRIKTKKSNNEGVSLNVSYKSILGGLEKQIDNISMQIDQEYQPAKVVFNPDSQQMFSFIPPVNEVKVDKVELMNKIDASFANQKVADIQIPVVEIVTQIDEKEILSTLGQRSKFSTNYAKSSSNRKSNIQKALGEFNGMVILPQEEVSFNNTTGPRTVENGYKKANIILNGAYVEGAGGGVCQASTTLYNAVVLAGMEVVDRSNHSLPASYVPLSFDAMVSEGTSDLIFKNNYDFPMYIRTYGTDTDAIVEVYGNKFEKGESIQTRAELVKIIPHDGDKIIPDTNGEYENYVIYKGEYHRVKYPKEGYESKAYIQFLKDGKVVEEKEIRHDYYLSQSGIIAEGVENVPEGITLPQNKVTFIPPQKVTKQDVETAKNKIKKESVQIEAKNA